jgi:hypothetical protein
MKKTHYSFLQFVGKIQYSDDGLVDEEEIHRQKAVKKCLTFLLMVNYFLEYQ